MEQPLVSFCIPVHNAGPYLEATLTCLLLQDYPHVEIICVDDHSTDQSRDILNSFAGRIKVYEATKRGAGAARNLAFEKCSGDYIVFFDADDLISHNYVSSQVSKVSDHQCVVICQWGRFHLGPEDFKENADIVKSDLTLYEWVLHYWTHNLHTTPPGRVLIPRGILKSAGLWDEELSLNDDLDFFTRVFHSSRSILYNDDAVFLYRSGINGVSSKTRGWTYQLSNWKSFEKATSLVSSSYPGDQKIRRACANMWQQFVYGCYPGNRLLIREANGRIKS
ncbi:MAG: glycosyltransferase family 2 protein, partial [Chitinophagaceae bacterium]